MIVLTKTYASDFTSEELERLYNEAFPYISQERKRVGEAELKSFLLNDFGDHPIIKYEVDGYLVGVASYTKFEYNNRIYLFHRHPIYGQTATGSRGWWYSEEFQQKNSEYVRAEGLAGVVTLFNPNSAAGKAVGSHFGSFDKYYNRPVVIEDPEAIGIPLNPTAKGIMQAYVIDLMD